MKRLIRWLLNHIPRRWLQRMASWAVPVVGLAYKGRGRECPVCGSRYRRFMPYGYVTSREDALCPHCLALERHRMIWLWLSECSDLFESRPRLLHIAPEVSLMRHFKRLYRGTENYITADLESPLADMHFDVQHIPLEDCSVDVVICNHLLEHVEDDRRAMRELYRILRPGGWGIALVPEDRSLPTTFEDDSITDPKERTRIFGQYDHRRIYGRDYDMRLAEAGFRVERIGYREQLTEAQQRLYAIGSDDLVIIHKD
ncbi:MAG: methyltransferase domain-containing protein [Alistipes sp.]|nr:methyltransferase domain-containing protein [Alistipes sp.]